MKLYHSKFDKIEETYVYHGFGFPLVLHNVPMIEVRGEWTPNLKWNEFEKLVLLALAHHPEELSGNQVRFIRHSLEMNQRDFANLFGVTQALSVSVAGNAVSFIGSLRRTD